MQEDYSAEQLCEKLVESDFAHSDIMDVFNTYKRSMLKVEGFCLNLELFQIKRLRDKLTIISLSSKVKNQSKKMRQLERQVRNIELQEVDKNNVDDLYINEWVQYLRREKFSIQTARQYFEFSRLKYYIGAQIGYKITWGEVFNLAESLQLLAKQKDKSKQERSQILGQVQYVNSGFMGRKSMFEQSERGQRVDKLIKEWRSNDFSFKLLVDDYRRVRRSMKDGMQKLNLDQIVRLQKSEVSHMKNKKFIEKAQFLILRKACIYVNRKLKQRISDIKYYSQYDSEKERYDNYSLPDYPKYYDQFERYKPPPRNDNLSKEDLARSESYLKKVERKCEKVTERIDEQLQQMMEEKKKSDQEFYSASDSEDQCFFEENFYDYQ